MIYIDIYKAILVKKEETISRNMESATQTDWEWMSWDEFVAIDEKDLFPSFSMFFKMGYKDLESILKVLKA